MLWGYAQFPDETTIAHSELKDDGTITIAIERPRDWGFDSAWCLLPEYRWSEVDGFSQEEVTHLEEFLRNNAPLIYEFARDPENRWEAA